jgi:hypothetical protein
VRDVARALILLLGVLRSACRSHVLAELEWAEIDHMATNRGTYPPVIVRLAIAPEVAVALGYPVLRHNSIPRGAAAGPSPRAAWIVEVFADVFAVAATRARFCRIGGSR